MKNCCADVGEFRFNLLNVLIEISIPDTLVVFSFVQSVDMRIKPKPFKIQGVNREEFGGEILQFKLVSCSLSVAVADRQYSRICLPLFTVSFVENAINESFTNYFQSEIIIYIIYR